MPGTPVHAPQRFTFLRLVLWLFLGAWFFVLANDRLGDPLRLGVGLGEMPREIRSYFSSMGPVAHAPVSPEISQPGTPLRPLPTREQQPQPETPIEPSTETENTPTPLPVERVDRSLTLSPELIGRLSGAFSRGDLDAARAMLRNAPDSAAVRAAGELMDEVPEIDRLVEEGIMRMRGQEVAIEFNNVSRQVIPLRVANGRIAVQMATDKRTVEFDTDRLAPKEKLRWVGKLDTPAKQVAACAMMLKANDNAFVAARAGACGILAPAFEMAANR
jgi:hypothetical protein